MTERVYGLSGKTVEVSTPNSPPAVPIATPETAGIVSVGDGLKVSAEGLLSIAKARYVESPRIQDVTDFESAQRAINDLTNVVELLLDSLKIAKILDTGEM
ncbi:hypothetical protein [Ewingella americana]|uniref:hypothetical protein n=1 Tax=Ewingella americana TaxID=41202 RepID=UPI0012AE2569|nr:hypothetical protein [Ewingella americana]MRT01895.1 hypothetical protein [Ewingella americana]